MRAEGVGRRYGVAGEWVLRDVDLAVPGGALVRVHGGNGSGKSTLLRLLAGVEAPSRGRITGRPRTAYVPERFPPALPMTALEYLTHLGRAHGLRRAAAAREAAGWLERFGAAAYARTPLARLSKGTCQKVAVGQALLARPGLLVLDEAWTGLDRAAREVLDRAVAERVAGGGAVVFVDHDPRRLPGAAAYRLADGRLVPAPAVADRAVTGGGPAVRIEAEGPPGAGPPSGLPGSAAVAEAPAAPGGPYVLTADPAFSDLLLRALLERGWHIRQVRDDPCGARTRSAGPAAGAAAHPAADTAGGPAAGTAGEEAR